MLTHELMDEGTREALQTALGTSPMVELLFDETEVVDIRFFPWSLTAGLLIRSFRAEDDDAYVLIADGVRRLEYSTAGRHAVRGTRSISLTEFEGATDIRLSFTYQHDSIFLTYRSLTLFAGTDSGRPQVPDYGHLTDLEIAAKQPSWERPFHAKEAWIR